MRMFRVTSVAVLGFGLLSCGAWSQEAPSPGGPPPPSDAAPLQDDSQLSSAGTLKVRVNLVNTYFSVRDKQGFLTGLHKEDCSIEENKIPQKIKNFTQEKTLPLTIGILLDTSGSQMNVLPLEKDAGAQFLKDVLQPKDEAFLIKFDINVDMLADYTNSPRDVEAGLGQGRDQHGRWDRVGYGKRNSTRHAAVRRGLSRRTRQAAAGGWPEGAGRSDGRRRPGQSVEAPGCH